MAGSASKRLIYAAPGIQKEAAEALAKKAGEIGVERVSVSIDLDEHTIRMGYGCIEAIDILRSAGIEPVHSPGFRSGILIIDDRGWVFTPTALYLENEPQSDETPNAVELSESQVNALAIRLSPQAHQEAVEQAQTPEEAQEIAQVPLEVGAVPVSEEQLELLKGAISHAPPVNFDVVRQVRVFEPYLQYVEISLIGASVQRKKIVIPKSLQNLGSSKILDGRLRTTLDLVDDAGPLSSRALEQELNDIRKNFTPSLGPNHGRVVLKVAKPLLDQRLKELEKRVEIHRNGVEAELQARLDELRNQVVDHYLPLVMANPPDGLRGGVLKMDEAAIRPWLEDQLRSAFPPAKDLVNSMALTWDYKDVTYETLNRPDFLGCVYQAFPHINWEKPYDEFKAAGEGLRNG